jgi:3-oxoacyl-[acyl-carrier protein] reductase
MSDFSNRKVLVTGGSRGIGVSIVEAFVQAGALVTYTGKSKSPSQIIEKAQYKSLDFSDDTSIDTFFSKPENLQFDILINNAGINKIDHFHEIPLEDFRLIQKVNLEGPMRLSQKVIPYMQRNKFGRLVNVASIFSSISKEKRASYSSSKFALVGMTKAVAIEYAAENILANVISPGFIDTELTRKILSTQQIAELTSLVPARRLGNAEEISRIVLFLASPKNTFITGQNIIADGGFTCV